MKNWYNELSIINVNSHVEQKNGLSYLSWMWAWDELKKRYPLSYATVHETADGSLVWKDPIGGHVKTSVTIVWEEEDGLHEHTATEYLPIFDFRNKVIPYENIDAMNVNKTVQRSLTKCIARLGLGGYIYAGEDLPTESIEITDLMKQIDTLVTGITSTMDSTAKNKFAKEIIVPIIGVANYKMCKDVSKLEDLIEAIKKYKE